MRVVTEDSDESMSLEEAGFNWRFPSDPSYNMGLRHWLELMMRRSFTVNPDGTIDCIITNINDKYTFEIIPSWLPKDERPPKSFALRPSKINNQVTLFVKCVRVKVK